MSQVDEATSADGTTIAYEAYGTGPVAIIVGGAFCDRGLSATSRRPSGGSASPGSPTTAGAGATAATPSPTRSPARSRT